MSDFLFAVIAIAFLVLIFSLWGTWCEHQEKKEREEFDRRAANRLSQDRKR